MQINKKAYITIIITIALASTLYVFYTYIKEEHILIGELYANDCGVPKGGFVWCGTYNITIKRGYLYLKLKAGLGDPLRAHKYPCKILSIKINQSITIELKDPNKTKTCRVELKYYEKDPIWGINNTYIAYYIDPTIFPGFTTNYYVEIRIHKIE